MSYVAGGLTDTELRATPVPVSGPLTSAQLSTMTVAVSGPLTSAQLSAMTVAVSGPLTDTQLRASAVPVSGPLTNAQLRAADVPVSGPLTDAQLRASAVPVSGPLTSSQLSAMTVAVSGPLTNAQLRAAAVSVSLADGVEFDAFNRLRTSTPTTLFDSQQEYGLDTLRLWDADANGTLSYSTGSSNGSVTSGSNAVGPRNSNTRMTPITCSSTNNHYAILQSRAYHRYVPGKSQLVLITGIFASGASASVSFIQRTSTSGSVSDAKAIAQADWNKDKFNGSGASGITLDFTKTQILFIDLQALFVGRVRFGFYVNGCATIAHEVYNDNTLTVPYIQTANLPIRMQAKTSGSTTICDVGYFDSANGAFLRCTVPSAGGTIYFICCSVQSEAGFESRGFPFAASNGTTTIGVTTRRPILSIRNAATFNSLVNRGHIELAELALSASTNAAYWELVIGGTLTGASFTSITNSSAEYDVSATAISGGITLISGFVVAGSGTVKGLAGGEIDLRGALTISKIDSGATTQPALSLVCTSFSGTSNLSGAFHWHEQTV